MTRIKERVRKMEEKRIERFNNLSNTMTFNQYKDFLKKQVEYYTEKYEKALESETAGESTLTYYAGLKMAFETAYEQAERVRK